MQWQQVSESLTSIELNNRDCITIKIPKRTVCGSKSHSPLVGVRLALQR